jgi:assimilatory nitrate reductase catalytic subunit
VSREWAVSQLVENNSSPRTRSAVLAGRPGAGGLDRGAIVCACFGIGANEIAGAVARGCTSVAAVGAATQAGTNCGSCRAEIRNILDAQLAAAPAAAPRVVVPA